MKRFNRGDGFTLIELLVTISIVGIMLGIAVPSFVSFIQGARALTQANALPNSLNYARSEAVRRNVSVHVLPKGGGDPNWGAGWWIWVDQNNNSVLDVGTDLILKEQAGISGGDGTLTRTSGSAVPEIVFDGSGQARTIDNNGVVFSYRANHSECRLGKDIKVITVGRVAVDKQAGCP